MSSEAPIKIKLNMAFSLSRFLYWAKEKEFLPEA
jgi:hypothetical protein